MAQVNDFISVLDGLEAADRVPAIYSAATVDSTLLRKCVIATSERGQFPEMSSAISFFRNAFDAAPAKKDGVIKPKPGVDTVFDDAKVSVTTAKTARCKHAKLQGRGWHVVSWAACVKLQCGRYTGCIPCAKTAAATR